MSALIQVHRSLSKAKASAGMSLIELMVAITIALVMSLAIFSALSISEGKKRTLTSTNDVNQAGIFASYQLEKLIKNAGSGYSQSSATTYGCLLKASLGTTGQILPYVGPSMLAPFDVINATVSGAYKLAPIIIVKDASAPNVSASGDPLARSDGLIIMSGSAGFGEVPTLFSSATGSQLNLQNTVSFRLNDLVLAVGQSATTGSNLPCMIEQVDASFPTGGLATALPLGGNYYANTIAGTNITDYSSAASILNLGSATVANNPPSMKLLAVGNNNALLSYDLLQMGTYNDPTQLADGIFEMHALYGVDSDNNGTSDAWRNPTMADGMDATMLENGTAASSAKLRSIKSIRLGLILRTSLRERDVVQQPPLTLFSDLGSSYVYTRALSHDEKFFRYRTIELTIPLRNALLLLPSS
jgi:type IV pilus assembly protein PilW